MVELRKALLIIDDAALVQGPDVEVACIDSDRNGLLGDRGLELSGRLGLDGFVAFDEILLLLLSRKAIDNVPHAGGVFPVFLKLKTCLLRVVEGIVLPAAVTALEGLDCTGDNLLVGHRDKLAGLNGMRTFDSSDAREGPAGAAIALVFDRIDRIFVTPVHLSG